MAHAGSVPATPYMSTTITLETLIDAPAELCFDMVRNVDTHIASTAGTGEKAVAGVTSGLLAAGVKVTWEARHLGLRWRLTSRITEFDPPRRFVDEQVQGPCGYWRHEHRFNPDTETIRMVDQVRYRMPLGVVGGLSTGLSFTGASRRPLGRRCRADGGWFSGSGLVSGPPSQRSRATRGTRISRPTRMTGIRPARPGGSKATVETEAPDQ